MKKILAIVLAAVMVLGIATSAMALSWAAPAASSSASPFAIEVIKLGVNADVTGAKYYTVLNDAAAFDYSTIYFAIKLSVPSYANANSYYGNSGFLSGDKVKVTITFTNVSGKGTETYYVKLTNQAQTLWYNGSGFDASWTAALNNNCGCGNNHIKSAVATGNKEVSIKACVGASGKLGDIKIDGCYTVEEKTYYGVVPCVNCAPTNLKGFLFKGDCANYSIFFSVNAANKVTGAYVVDKNSDAKAQLVGAALDFNKKLYGWAPNGTTTDCATGSCGIVTFERVELPVGALINTPDWETWENTFNYDDKTDVEMATLFEAWKGMAENAKKDWNGDSFNQLYYIKDDAFKKASWADIAPDDMAKGSFASGGIEDVYYWDDTNKKWATYTSGTGLTDDTGVATNFFAGDKLKDNESPANAITDTTKLEVGGTVSSVFKSSTLGYRYNGAFVQYGKTKYYKGSGTDDYLYKQTSATTVNCDTNEAAYINALNHLYALLGFTYADIAAGNVYMSEDILLANFGFSTSVCDTKVWGAYTAAITVATVAEVPATGSVTYVGFAMIVLAIAAAVVTKKVRA